jgi:hypothetical protein
MEGILTHMPFDDEEEKTLANPLVEEDYSIVNVRRKVSSPSPPPSPERLPTIQEELDGDESASFLHTQNKEEIAVQTSSSFLSLSPSPRRPTPPSSPRKEVTPPVVPQIIIQQHLPPQQEGERGIEKELVELLSTLVHTQQTTMQGQQALLLSVLQQQQQQMNIHSEETIVMEEVQEEKKMEEIVKEKKEAVLEEVKEEEEETIPVLSEEDIQPERKIRYNTSFGEFLLGGKQLFGKYKVKEKLPFHEYNISQEMIDQNHREDERRDIIALPFDEPRTRRRANPLTMKLLYHNDKEEERKVKKVPISSTPSIDSQQQQQQQQQFMEFANKLLDTVSMRDKPDDKKEEAWKKELSQAVHEGIALGLKQVLGYLPPSKKEKKYIKNNLGKPYYSRAITGKADLKRLSFERFEKNDVDDSNEEEEEDDKEGRKHYHLPYMEETWEKKAKSQKKNLNRNESKRDDLKEFQEEMEKSKRNTYQLASGKGKGKGKKKQLEEDNDEMTSDGYNDSISLSEEYYAFYGVNEDDNEGFEPRRKGSNPPSSMRYMLESDDDAAVSEEEGKEYTVNDIVGYDSNEEDDALSDVQEAKKETKCGHDRLSIINDDDDDEEDEDQDRNFNKAVVIHSKRIVSDRYVSDDDQKEGNLLPLISAVLTQPETEKIVLSSKQEYHRSNKTRNTPLEESVDDSDNISDNEDDVYSLLSSQENDEKLSKRKGNPMGRYVEDSDEDDFSAVTEGIVVSSDEEYHHDHRKKGLLQASHKERKETKQLVLTKHLESSFSSSSRSPSSSPSSSDKQNLSLSTADSSFDKVDGLIRHHHTNPSTYHQIRYSSSEIRMKRKGALSSLNTKKRSTNSSVILPHNDKRERKETSEEKRGEIRRTDIAKDEREVRYSVSDDDERKYDRSYNSMLSSEESSIVSERLAILRKENHRLMKDRKEEVLSNLNEEEKDDYSKAMLALGEQKGRSTQPNYSASFSSSNASSNDFSVNTPSSSASVDTGHNRKGRFDPYSKRKKLVNLSIPLLTVNDRKR